MAPTSALKVNIALDLAACLFLPGSKAAIDSRSFLTCSEVSARVRLSLRAISGASALKAQPNWILAVHIAHIIVDKLLKGERLPDGFSSFLLALPDAECIAERLGHEFVTRIEVLVEAAHR